ncbi:MAG TPA: LuxR C-terminal-related transcriptional regulator, partial [Segeticoccus sp.]|nr:LuxR C-terminal-related transcriptional regulator [Segeticoccus sp.]
LVRAEGGWDAVERGIEAHSRQLVGSHGWLAAAGYYELGEVRRLRGDPEGARRAFGLVRALGDDPQPGAALLLASAGDVPGALAELQASLAGRDRLGRARLLLPAVEVALEAGEPAYAAVLADELEAIAAFHDSPGLRARAQQARALLHLRSGRPSDALPLLDGAARTYREQRFRHASAAVHELLAQAHRELGHEPTAAAEEATALAIYRQLGAGPDVRRLSREEAPGGLSPRELQVLACIASGAGNRAVAHHLVISEKTVSRHLANIYLKLGVGSRTAAAAWAHEHGIAPASVD